MSVGKTIYPIVTALLLIAPLLANADAHGAKDAIAMAVASDVRTEQDKARDASRKPAETLEFFGIKEDMRVLEIMPGRGWYTKILNSIVKDKGQLYIAIGAGRLDMSTPGVEGVKIAGTGYEFERVDAPGFIINLAPGNLELQDLDMVLTFRNAHNLIPSARTKLHAEIFDALATGGVYGIIDHTQRHMSTSTAEAWRRIDPVKVIKEVLDAGFQFEGYSALHHRPSDNLEFDSLHESIKGDSDRFTLKFVKP